MTATARLSVGVAAPMAVAAAWGLVAPDVYHDTALVRAGWLGNDLVTLLVAVPLLALSAHQASRGSARGLLGCVGLLAYALYDYAFYLFGAAFNALFLAYVAILALATLGLIAGLASRETKALLADVRIERAHRRVGIVVAVVAAALGFFWIATSAAYWVTGDPPAMVAATGHPTNVTGALDLWLVVTFGLLGGVWLARGRAWGFVISAVWAIKSAVYMAALSAASVTAFRAGALADLTQLVLWLPIGVICGVAAIVLLGSVDRATR